MSFFLSCLAAALRAQLRDPRTWLLLLLPLAVFGAKALLPAQQLPVSLWLFHNTEF